MYATDRFTIWLSITRTKTIPHHLQTPCTHEYEFLNRCISLIFILSFPFDSILGRICIGVFVPVYFNNNKKKNATIVSVCKKEPTKIFSRRLAIIRKENFRREKRAVFFLFGFHSVCLCMLHIYIICIYIEWTETPPSPLRKFHL